MQVTLTVNGDEVTREIEPRLLLVHFLRDELGLTGHPLGLRHLQLRHLRRADGRRAGEVVHGARGDGRWTRRPHRREPRARRHARPRPAGLHRGARPPVRVLHAGHDDDRPRAARHAIRTPAMRRSARRSRARSAAARATRTSSRRSAGPRATRSSRPATQGAELMATVEEPARSATAGTERKEDPRFIRGKGNYVDDVEPARACCTARCCAARSRTRASSRSTPPPRQQHPKVHAVITGKDLEGLKLAWMPTLSGDMQAVLATDKVRFQGQEVAFVVADDRYSARDALELIDVEYEPLDRGGRRAQARSTPTRPVIRDDMEGRTDNHIFDWEAGDRGRGRRGVRRRRRRGRRRTCSIPRSHPAPMETCGVGGRLRRGHRQAHAVDARRRRRTRTARCTRSWPGCPSTRSA